MDARPLLEELTKALREARLDAILIGNAAAALQGAPVTTLDFDFYFRRTPRNLQKLKTLAETLHAVVLRPYYPSSGLFRVVRDEDGLQADFMDTIDGVTSFATLRSRARQIPFGETSLMVADLADVIRSKRAAGRPRDQAVLDILEKALHEEGRQTSGDTKQSARGTKGRK